MSKKTNKTSPAAIQIGLRGIMITEKGLEHLHALRGLVAELNVGRQKRITMMRIIGDWRAADRAEAAEELNRLMERLDRMGPMHH